MSKTGIEFLSEWKLLAFLKMRSVHLNAAPDDGMAQKTHEEVAALIRIIIDGGNSVRCPPYQRQ